MFRVFVASTIFAFSISVFAATDRTLTEKEEVRCLTLIYTKNVFGDEKPKTPSSGGFSTPTPGQAVRPFKQGDYLPKLVRIEKAAEEGNLFAHSTLMEMNLSGTCINGSMDKALYHMEKAWGYFGYSMFLMQAAAMKGNDKEFIKEAYKWLRVAEIRYPYIDKERIHISMVQKGLTPTDDKIKRFILSVQPEKSKLEYLIQKIKTTDGLSESDIEDAESEVRSWISEHPTL